MAPDKVIGTQCGMGSSTPQRSEESSLPAGQAVRKDSPRKKCGTTAAKWYWLKAPNKM
ncbi:MAG: hypothetical protein ACKVOM_02875 [Ferruginibacter sp.]